MVLHHMKTKDKLIKELNASRKAYHEGADVKGKCPICGRLFRFTDCPHNVSEVDDRLFENYVKSIVKLELLSLVKENERA